MVDVIKNHQLDLLHVHYAIPHASAAYMAKKIVATQGKNIPVITTLHGTDITLVGRDKTLAPVVAFSINESDAITAVSQNLRDETYEHFRNQKGNRSDPQFCGRQPISEKTDRSIPKSNCTQRMNASWCMHPISEK